MVLQKEDRFGISVASLLVTQLTVEGAYRDDSNNSIDNRSTFVFTQAKLTASDGATDDWFGYSVAIAGDTIVAGAYWADTDSGRISGAKSVV